MHRRFKAPSPALVISLIALFVALGGTGYAASNGVFKSPPSTLQSGHSESGLFAGGGADVIGDWIGVAINYPRPLAAPIPYKRIIDVQGSSATHCPGAGHAARGYLCFYNRIESGVDVGTDFYSTSPDVLGKLGVVGYWSVNTTNGSPYIGGSWTVTAP